MAVSELRFPNARNPGDDPIRELRAELEARLAQIARALSADAVTLLLYDSEAGDFDLPVQHGLLDPETFTDPALVPGTDRLAGRIVRERSPEYVEDVTRSPATDGPFTRRERVVSTAAVPLNGAEPGSPPVGILFVSFRSPQTFSAARRTEIESWGRETAAIILRNDPFPLLRERRRGPGSETDETLRTLVKLGCSLIDRPIAIWLPKPGSDELRIRAATGLTRDYLASASVRRDDGSVVDEVLRTGETILLDDLSSDLRFPYRAQAELAGWKSLATLPIRFRGQAGGVIQVFSFRPETLESLRIESLHRLAEMASLAMENARRSFESEELARLAGTISATPDVQSAMKVIAESAWKLTGGDSSTIVLHDKRTHSFVVGCRALRHPSYEPAEVIPRREHGLTRSIIETGLPVLVQDTETDAMVNPALRAQGVRSLVGVRLEVEGERFGALYVESGRPHQFSERDLRLLRTVADQASVALGWTRLLLEPWMVIEQSMANLFQLDAIIEDFCRNLDSTLGFDFSSLQLIRRDKGTIESIHATGIAREWGGRSRHHLNEAEDLRDIQADIALSRPLRTEILRGWDPRFDIGIYRTYHHDDLVRIFTPLVVVREQGGEFLEDWLKRCEWTVKSDDRGPGRQRTVIEVLLPEELQQSWDVEVIGTVEAGLRRADGELGEEQARALVEYGARNALSIRRTLLRHVNETIVEQARRIAHADSASLHFPWDAEQERFLYEVRSRGLATNFLDRYPPRPGGLGHQAIRDREVKLLPDPASHDVQELQRRRPDLAAEGIWAMGAFPLLVGDKAGVVYLHFRRPYRFREDEVRWVQLLANRAADAIRQATAYSEIRDRARQLTTLQSVVQDLVRRLGEPGLLQEIASSTLNTLAADIVTIYEYKQNEHQFLTPPDIAGRLRNEKKMRTEVREDDAPILLVKRGENLYESRDVEGNAILNHPGRRRPESGKAYFAAREGVKACAGVLLKVGEEIVGVMFINYRRAHPFSAEERRIIEALASAAAIAIKNQRLLAKLQEDLLTITHNVKAPLTSVSAAIMGLKRWSVPSSEMVDLEPVHVSRSFHEYLEHAYAASEDVLIMVSGIFNSLAREAGSLISLDPKRIDAPAEVRLLCERMQMINDRPDLQFVFEVQSDFPMVVFDRQTLTIAMYNLIQNATKYSALHSTVRIVCRYDRTASRAYIEVRSVGERIEPDEKEKIFEKFRRAKMIRATGRRHAGVGLGLWSARESMRAAGGDLRCELSDSQPQEAAFIIEIPVQKEDKRPRP